MAIKIRPKIALRLPFGLGQIDLEPNDMQEKAAWRLYVELTTRVAIQELQEDEGLLREALNSLYKVFQLTREVIRDAGPEIAQGPNSLGPVAINVLNKGLRPFMSKWHPRLLDHEAQRPQNVTPVTHERQWALHDEMRRDLNELQKNLQLYADALAQIAGAK